MAIKITGFLVSLIFFSLFVSIFGIYISNLNTNFSPPQYNNQSIATFNKLDKLSDNTMDYKNKTTDKDIENFRKYLFRHD